MTINHTFLISHVDLSRRSVGRFLNADGYADTGDSTTSTNMFAYCGNNPVTRSDPTGQIFGIDDAAFWISAAAVLAIGALWTATMTETKDFTLPSAPSISWPKDDLKPKVDSKEKELAPTLPKRPKDPVHHIVAKADPRAAESRQILRDVGIDPLTDPINLVTLPQSYHASLHTTAYYNYVTEKLRPVAGNKAGVEMTLGTIRSEILVRSTLGIRWD